MSSTQLRETILPRLQRIENWLATRIVVIEHSNALTPGQAFQMTSWEDSRDCLEPCAGGRYNSGFSRIAYRVKHDVDTWPAFQSLADEAGQMLGPWSIQSGVRPETVALPDGFTKWLHAVVDLGLAGHLPIEIKRYWLSPVAARAGLLRSIHPDDEELENDIDGAERLGFYCELPDALRCSIYAIERMTEGDALPDDADPIEGVLQDQALKLYRRLAKNKNFVAYSSLADLDCWRDPPPEDRTIFRGLRKLQTELNNINAGPVLIIENDNARAKLTR